MVSGYLSRLCGRIPLIIHFARSFDDFTGAQCATFCAETMGRPGLSPGVYFRLLLIGYFEAWKRLLPTSHRWPVQPVQSISICGNISLKDL